MGPFQKTVLVNQEISIRKKNRFDLFQKIFILVFLCGAILACNQNKTDHTRLNSDNTGKNVRDVQGGPLTPESQSNNELDLNLTQKIRAELMNIDSLSVNAKNIKIITLNGIVTLRGPVDSQNEKELIHAKSQNIAGSDKVINQLEVVSH